MRKKRVAVFISGEGTNLQALINASQAADYPARITLVVSNKVDAGGIKRAEAAGIAIAIVPHEEYETRTAFEGAIQQALEEEDIELICLAGFMRLLSSGFVRIWEDRMINIHPSLLPKYRGLDTHARALEAGDDKAGCTAHFVVPEMDAGPIIMQESIPILEDDTPETLAERVLAIEHEIYPEALRRVALGMV